MRCGHIRVLLENPFLKNNALRKHQEWVLCKWADEVLDFDTWTDFDELSGLKFCERWSEHTNLQNGYDGDTHDWGYGRTNLIFIHESSNPETTLRRYADANGQVQLSCARLNFWKIHYFFILNGGRHRRCSSTIKKYTKDKRKRNHHTKDIQGPLTFTFHTNIKVS